MEKKVWENSKYPEKIIFWWKCLWYCSGKLENKSCGRMDIPCRNLINGDNSHNEHHRLCRDQFLIQEVWKEIQRVNDSLSDIY